MLWIEAPIGGSEGEIKKSGQYGNEYGCGRSTGPNYVIDSSSTDTDNIDVII